MENFLPWSKNFWYRQKASKTFSCNPPGWSYKFIIWKNLNLNQCSLLFICQWYWDIFSTYIKWKKGERLYNVRKSMVFINKSTSDNSEVLVWKSRGTTLILCSMGYWVVDIRYFSVDSKWDNATNKYVTGLPIRVLPRLYLKNFFWVPTYSVSLCEISHPWLWTLVLGYFFK